MYWEKPFYMYEQLYEFLEFLYGPAEGRGLRVEGR